MYVRKPRNWEMLEMVLTSKQWYNLHADEYDTSYGSRK